MRRIERIRIPVVRILVGRRTEDPAGRFSGGDRCPVQQRRRLAVQARQRGAVGEDRALPLQAGRAAREVERDVDADRIRDGREGFLVQVLADAVRLLRNHALVRREADVARGEQQALGGGSAAVELQSGVADHRAVRIGVRVDRNDGLVPQVDRGIGDDAGRPLLRILARRDIDRAVVRVLREDHHTVVQVNRAAAVVEGVADAGGRAGQAVSVGGRARIQLHVGAGADVDVAGVADDGRVGSDRDVGDALLHIDDGIGFRDRDRPAGIELGLVVGDDGVVGVDAERPGSGNRHHHVQVGALADAYAGQLEDLVAGAARRQADQAAGPGIDVPGRVVSGRGAVVVGSQAPPELVTGVVGGDRDVVRAEVGVVADVRVDGALHEVAGRGAARARHRGRGAVDLGVVDAVVLRHQAEAAGGDAAGGRGRAAGRSADLGQRVADLRGVGGGRRAGDDAAAAGDRRGDIGVGAEREDADRSPGKAARDVDVVAQRRVGQRVGGGARIVRADGDDADRKSRNGGALVAVVFRADAEQSGHGKRAAVADRAGNVAVVGGVRAGGGDAGEQRGRSAAGGRQRRHAAHRAGLEQVP